MGEGTPDQLRAHPSAFVQQFLHGHAEGPVEFQYSQQPYLSLAETVAHEHDSATWARYD
jgi:phospholipid/cholesterol/gamma-HCH transport system ATP-binding protein